MSHFTHSRLKQEATWTYVHHQPYAGDGSYTRSLRMWGSLHLRVGIISLLLLRNRCEISPLSRRETHRWYKLPCKYYKCYRMVLFFFPQFFKLQASHTNFDLIGVNFCIGLFKLVCFSLPLLPPRPEFEDLFLKREIFTEECLNVNFWRLFA